jgi:Sigma-70 region 2
MYPFSQFQLYSYRAMETVGTLEQAASEGWTDQEIVERVKAGDTALYEIIMRRYNQRLYRVARAILRDDAEAEDVMQDAFVRAYQHLDQFAGRAPFSAWVDADCGPRSAGPPPLAQTQPATGRHRG